MEKIILIHYFPVSYYPPTMNLVDTIEEKIDVEVITTRPDKGKFNYHTNSSKVLTPIHNKDNDKMMFRLLKYAWFTIYSLLKMIVRHPDGILYYESISAMPVYLYKRYFNRNVKVYVHYHEYATVDDYHRPGMRLASINHNKERSWLYQHSAWVSQTNFIRLDMFLDDNPMVERSTTHAFPNYPPKSWWRKKKVHEGGVCRCVYVGSLSLQDTFVKEFCEWVDRQKGRVTFDIYSFNFHNDTLEAINNIHSSYIIFHKEGVPYNEIPNLLDKYDVGLLLYKANSVNFQYNETNKFYEYLICGLDVWYPKEMLLLHDMDKNQFAPKIKEMDFHCIDRFEGAIKTGEVDNENYHWFAEDLYNRFAK